MSASNFTVDQIEERFGFRPNSQQIDAINSVVDWYRGCLLYTSDAADE